MLRQPKTKLKSTDDPIGSLLPLLGREARRLLRSASFLVVCGILFTLGGNRSANLWAEQPSSQVSLHGVSKQFFPPHVENQEQTDKPVRSADDSPPTHDLPLIGGEATPLQIDTSEAKVEQAERRVLGEQYFLEARMLVREGKIEEALRRYQRSSRYLPESQAAAHAVVDLALELERQPEAARYAKRYQAEWFNDGRQLLDMAAALTEQGEFKQAFLFYRQWLAGPGEAFPDRIKMIVQMEAARLAYLCKETEWARESFAGIFERLQRSKEIPDEQRAVAGLLSNAEQTYRLIGLGLAAADAWDLSEQALRAAHEFNHDDRFLHSKLAQLRVKQQRLPEARELLEQLLESVPGELSVADYRTLLELIRAESNETNLAEHEIDEEAIVEQWQKELTSWLVQRPDDLVLNELLARSLYDSGKSELALELLAPLWSERPSQQVAEMLFAIYSKSDRLPELVALLGDVERLQGSLQWLAPHNSDFQEPTRLTNLLLGAFPPSVVTSDPWSFEHAIALGRIAIRQGDLKKGEEYFQMAWRRQPITAKVDVLKVWSVELFEQECYSEAIEVLLDRLKREPATAAESQFLLTAAAALANEYELAEEALEEATRSLPGSVLVEQRRGWLQQQQGQLDEAKQTYQRIIERLSKSENPEDSAEEMRRARLALAGVLTEIGEQASAEEQLETVLDQNPEDAVALNDLGFLWIEQQKWLVTSLDMIQRAVAQEPNNPAFRDSLGWAYYRSGEQRQAVDELLMAIELDPHNSTYREHLAEVYRELGQQQDATQVLELPKR